MELTLLVRYRSDFEWDLAQVYQRKVAKSWLRRNDSKLYAFWRDINNKEYRIESYYPIELKRTYVVTAGYSLLERKGFLTIIPAGYHQIKGWEMSLTTEGFDFDSTNLEYEIVNKESFPGVAFKVTDCQDVLT